MRPCWNMNLPPDSVSKKTSFGAPSSLLNVAIAHTCMAQYGEEVVADGMGGGEEDTADKLPLLDVLHTEGTRDSNPEGTILEVEDHSSTLEVGKDLLGDRLVAEVAVHCPSILEDHLHTAGEGARHNNTPQGEFLAVDADILRRDGGDSGEASPLGCRSFHVRLTLEGFRDVGAHVRCRVVYASVHNSCLEGCPCSAHYGPSTVQVVDARMADSHSPHYLE